MTSENMDHPTDPIAGSGLRAIIFDIQRFSLHDGPGIRTTVFFKGCPLRCRWCQNPESFRSDPEMAFYRECCAACFSCEGVCPEGAIIRKEEHRIDYGRCTGCGLCAGQCPHNALRAVGIKWEAGPLVNELLRDRDHFLDSGGGVTFSGGEPMLHARFLAEVARRLKARGVNVAIETCGIFMQSDMEVLLPNLDLIFYDLKHMDDSLHREYTGLGNEKILENFRILSEHFPALQPRMPVVSGHNDDEKNIRATAAFIKGLGHRSIHCLPYHGLGEGKLIRIGKSRKLLDLKSPDRDEMTRVIEIFLQEGIDAVIYD